MCVGVQTASLLRAGVITLNGLAIVPQEANQIQVHQCRLQISDSGRHEYVYKHTMLLLVGFVSCSIARLLSGSASVYTCTYAGLVQLLTQTALVCGTQL